MKRSRFGWAGPLVLAILVLGIGNRIGAAEKLIIPPDGPTGLSRLKVAADGGLLYLAGGTSYHVVNPDGTLRATFAPPHANGPRDLFPLANGWLIGCHNRFRAQVALHRPDGTLSQQLIHQGPRQEDIHPDNTQTLNPGGVAVDEAARRIFLIESRVAPPGVPSPDWSRVARFDLDGKYLGDFHRFDASDPRADDRLRTWLCDVALDPKRQRVYVLTGRDGDILAFDYEGRPVGQARALAKAEAHDGGLAVTPEGRVVLGQGHVLKVLGLDLGVERTVPVDPSLGNVQDIEADSSGRLYAVVDKPGTWFLRWESNLEGPKVFGPDTLALAADFPTGVLEAGKPISMRVAATGRLGGPARRRWQALARPAEGGELDWSSLPLREQGDRVTIATPASLRGLYEVALRYGDGPIDRANLAADPSLSQVLTFLPKGTTRTLSLFTADGRRAYRQGEPIPFQLVRRGPAGAPTRVRLELRRERAVMATAELTVQTHYAGLIPSAFTDRLAPGHYRLIPEADGHSTFPMGLDLAGAEPDSPMQRILYHEFGSPIDTMMSTQPVEAERLAFGRTITRSARDLGFTRQTDRYLANRQAGEPRAWRRGESAFPAAGPLFPPPDAFLSPKPGSSWAIEDYLDRATASGLVYETQAMVHCGNVCFREPGLGQLVATLQRGAQRFERYPSFRGFNFNDEMFFSQDKGDLAWLDSKAKTLPPGAPRADVLGLALKTMYDRLIAATHEVDPSAKVTATPMWQFPATEGSYPPAIYRGMSESYSHFLSEGYQLPWYPAHSVEMLRRPGLPLMGVFDNASQNSGVAQQVYLKNAFQVLGRGVQGIGVEHVLPVDNPFAADALRLANLVARLYGPIFAEAPPVNELAILYSRTQDVTETRNRIGTPHWERVFALLGAGLMAGLPAEVAFEEDIAAGHLLRDGRPRVPMLLLTGQKQAFSETVRQAIDGYISAGGRVFFDADSAPYPNATRLDIQSHVLKDPLAQAYASDTPFPLIQPRLEALASALGQALGGSRRFPIDADDAWVSRNGFDGGAVRYLFLARETSPYPWPAPEVWSLGTTYSSNVLPTTVNLKIPWTSGALYDVFDHSVIQPKIEGNKATFPADLTLIPGRLFAIAPAPLGSPKLSAEVSRDAAGVAIRYRVSVVDDQGRPLPARVPIRVRLVENSVTEVELIRSTGVDGALAGTIPLPLSSKSLTLEVTELLGGRGSSLPLAAEVPATAMVNRRPDVEPLREDRLRALIAQASGTLRLVLPPGVTSPPANLVAGLRERGISLKPLDELPKEPVPGVYLAVGVIPQMVTGNHPDDLAWLAWSRGLLPYSASAENPGPGRGFFAPAFSPRADREHAIVLLASDGPGLGKTFQGFLDWLGGGEERSKPSGAAKVVLPPAVGKASRVASVPRMSDLIGPRLSDLVLSADGKHLAVSAEGYARNVALLEDLGDRAWIVRAARVGQAPRAGSLFVSADGQSFGASSRTTSRVGEAFHLGSSSSEAFDAFASFGDIGGQRRQFAVNDEANLVIAPGSYGYTCWRRDSPNANWRDVWTRDAWKDFREWNWPIDPVDERLPQFDAVIPHRADFALILGAETAENGWITSEHPHGARLSAVGLADGKERWGFDVPIPGKLLLPTLRTSPDGSRVLLVVQVGSFGQPSYQCFSVAEGRSLGHWSCPGASRAVALSDKSGLIAQAYEGRILEIRRPDGTMLMSRIWPDQPIGLAFAPDGQGIFVADDAGHLTSILASGGEAWRVAIGCRATLATRGDRLYVAGYDGRVRAYGLDGRPLWTLDTTPALNVPRPMDLAARSTEPDGPTFHEARRPPTSTAKVPDGPNLLKTGDATLTVGGTKSWMSSGEVLVTPAQLTDGKRKSIPWLSLNELFWAARAGRQVWAEISFKSPTSVKALTILEDPEHPESWPTDSLVQVWDEPSQSWKTAERGCFLTGPDNTYPLNLKDVKKLRYVPWGNYYRNVATSEIEVR